MYLVVLCRRSMMTSTLAKEQLDNVRVTGTIHKLGEKRGKKSQVQQDLKDGFQV